MSEFINNLKLKPTGNKIADTPTLQLSIDHEYLSYSMSDEYVASVEWKRKFIGRESTKELIFSNVRKELQELIYGECKVLLFLLERAIYEEDNKKQLKILGKIYKEIGYA